jgi:hypothetical protein
MNNIYINLYMSNSFFVTRGVDICNNFVTLSDTQSILGAKTFSNGLSSTSIGTSKIYSAGMGTSGTYIKFTGNNGNYLTLDITDDLANHNTAGCGISVLGSEKLSIRNNGVVTINGAIRSSSTLELKQDANSNGGAGSYLNDWYYNLSYNGSVLYYVYRSGSNTLSSSGTISDERLKEDNGLATDTSVIDNLKVHNFTWKEDKIKDMGVFAQEAYQVKPSAVSVGKDELTDEGKLKVPWGVDYTKFVPDLIVYCQQLKKQVQSQQDQINHLQQQVSNLLSR